MKALIESLGQSPLGLLLKPIFKFIKKANAGSVRVLEIQYDEVHLNEHKIKATKSSTQIEDIPARKSYSAPPPPPPPRSKKITAKHAGYGGSTGSPGSSGTGGTSGQINTNGTSSRITWEDEFSSADEYFDHFHEPINAKKAAPKQIDPSSLPNGTFNRLLQEYEAKKSFKIKA